MAKNKEKREYYWNCTDNQLGASRDEISSSLTCPLAIDPRRLVTVVSMKLPGGTKVMSCAVVLINEDEERSKSSIFFLPPKE